MSLDGDGGLLTAVGTWTAVGQELVVSGLICDLVRQCTVYGVVFDDIRSRFFRSQDGS